MGYRSLYSGTEKVDLDGHYFVRLRHMTVDELMKMGEANLPPTVAGLRSLCMCIVEWTLDEDDGSIIPISEEEVRKLPVVHFNMLMEKQAEMAGVKQEASEKAAFPGFPATGDSGPREAAAGAPGLLDQTGLLAGNGNPGGSPGAAAPPPV